MRFSRRKNGLMWLVLIPLVFPLGVLAGDLTVNGQIESQGGGVVFPDGSVQVTAAGNGAPIAVSGEWDFAGMTILPRMILHDIVFYVSSDDSPPCVFTMNYVIDTVQSRTIRQFSLSVDQSAELHFEAGIDSDNLRFGTIGGGTCVRHWLAMGFAVE